MHVRLNRLDPNVPDPVESRRRAAGRLVRIAYATIVFGVLAFFVSYFGAPFVFLSGPGQVSASRYVVSAPYTVVVRTISVTAGARIAAGEEIAHVRSPEVDTVVATYMRSLAEVATRVADLRVKARVADQSLEAARSHLRVTEEAVDRVDATSAASTSFRLEVFRERAAAQKSTASLEAEAAETAVQLATLDEFAQQLRDRLTEIESNFAGGHIVAPASGIISTNVANMGQSLAAGTPIVEILDPNDAFVEWYIPSARLIDPKVGNQVFVVFGTRRIFGTIAEILPVSGVYAGTQSVMRERSATQLARIKFDAGAEPPALNSTVSVHMHYSKLSAGIAVGLVNFLGLD